MPYQVERRSDVGKQSRVPPKPRESENVSWSRRSSTVLPEDEEELFMQEGGGRVYTQRRYTAWSEKGVTTSGPACLWVRVHMGCGVWVQP